MKLIVLRAFRIFAVIAFLAIPVFGASGTVLAKDADSIPQQTGFRWQMAVELTPDTNGAPAEALSALGSDGVNASVIGKQLVMDGQGSLEQARAALFDTASPWMDFLGGPVELTLHLPANNAALTLKLEARITAGYRWEIVPEPGALYTETAESTFDMRYQGYGAPAIQTVRLQATGQGDTTVKLVYKRPFGSTERIYARLSIWMPTAADLELSDPTPVAPARNASLGQSDAVEPDPLAELLPKALPASWDWRTKGVVTPIRNQRSCGSCWAFATVGAMEAALKKSGGPAADLSEQFLVSCNTEGWSCNGGWDSHEYHYNILGKKQTQVGAVLESAKPYTATNGSCSVALSHPYKLNGWGYVGGLNGGNYWYSIPSYAKLKSAIYTYGPITAGVCVGNAFSYYTGGLFTTNEVAVCGSSPNHLIVLVGWNDADQSLILRNSWDTGWGEDGYMRIKYGTSMVGIAPTWVTRTASKPAPTLIAPGGAIHTRKPTYTWSRIGAAASYKLQVYDPIAASFRINTTVSGSFCSAATNRCTYIPNVILAYNKNYQWRVAAGTGPWSAWKIFKPIP